MTFLFQPLFQKEGDSMTDFINSLASKSGVSPDQATKGMGAVLALLKDKLPADAYDKVAGAVPNADSMTAAAEEATRSAGGGILETVKGMAGKLFGGGGGAAALLGSLSQLGFSADQVQSFLANVLGFLKGKLPDNVVQQISGLIPMGEKVGT